MKKIVVIGILAVLLCGCTSRDTSSRNTDRIIFLGDSITELGEKPNGYVSRVRDTLTALGYPYEVVGAGVSGNKVPDLLARLDRDVLRLKPSVVVIYIGVNDVWHQAFASRGLSGTPKSTYRKGLTTLINRIRSSGAKVILCTPAVIGEKAIGENQFDAILDEYSDISRKVASADDVPVCDLRAIFRDYIAAHNPINADRDILTTDGVHLNDTGNRLVANAILQSFDGIGLFFPKR